MRLKTKQSTDKAEEANTENRFTALDTVFWHLIRHFFCVVLLVTFGQRITYCLIDIQNSKTQLKQFFVHIFTFFVLYSLS